MSWARNSQDQSLWCVTCVGRRGWDILLSTWSNGHQSFQQTGDPELVINHEENLIYLGCIGLAERNEEKNNCCLALNHSTLDEDILTGQAVHP